MTCGVRASYPNGYDYIGHAPGSPESTASWGGYIDLSFLDESKSLRVETVRSIEAGPETVTYDLAVDSTENFVAGGFVVHNTRWHEDDLVGRIIREMTDDPTSERWEVIRMPAIAEEDEDWGVWHRKAGEALWPARYPLESLERIRKVQSARYGAMWWLSLYQQRPSAPEGSFFRREYFCYYDQTLDHRGDKSVMCYRLRRPSGEILVPIDDCWKFCTVDLAISTSARADYTVVSTWAVTPPINKDGEMCLLLLDVQRQKIEAPEQQALIEEVNARWRPVSVFIEAVAYQQSLIQILRRQNVPVDSLSADKDKRARATTAASMMKARQIFFPAGASFLPECEAELLGFDNLPHDDFVDTLAYAARYVVDHSSASLGVHLP